MYRRNGKMYCTDENDLIAMFVVRFLELGYTRTMAHKTVAKVLQRTFATIETHWTNHLKGNYQDAVKEAVRCGKSVVSQQGNPSLEHTVIEEIADKLVKEFVATHPSDSPIRYLLMHYHPEADITDYEALLVENEVLSHRVEELEAVLSTVLERARVAGSILSDLEWLAAEHSVHFLPVGEEIDGSVDAAA